VGLELMKVETNFINHCSMWGNLPFADTVQRFFLPFTRSV